jgi:hypothetical protein
MLAGWWQQQKQYIPRVAIRIHNDAMTRRQQMPTRGTQGGDRGIYGGLAWFAQNFVGEIPDARKTGRSVCCARLVV